MSKRWTNFLKVSGKHFASADYSSVDKSAVPSLNLPKMILYNSQKEDLYEKRNTYNSKNKRNDY